MLKSLARFMATAIDKSVVSKTCKFIDVDISMELAVRSPQLPANVFQPNVQISKLGPETKALHLENTSQNNGDADWFHPFPIAMSVHHP